MPESKRNLAPEARRMYAGGEPIERIAEVLDVSPSTIYRWRAAGEQAGTPWPEPGSESSFDPRRITHLIEQRLMRVAQDDDPDLSDGAWVDRVTKGLRALERTYDLYGDVAVRLNAMHGFVEWCVDRLPDEDLETIRRVVPDYLEHLRRTAE